MQRIAVFALTLVLTAAAAVPRANADSYPSRPIRLIIGFPPGSAADITARLVGDIMSRTLGQQVVVEARPGAGSSIAAEFVAHSPADGYTLFIGTLSNVTNAVTSSNLHFDFAKDFAPVAPLTACRSSSRCIPPSACRASVNSSRSPNQSLVTSPTDRSGRGRSGISPWN